MCYAKSSKPMYKLPLCEMQQQRLREPAFGEFCAVPSHGSTVALFRGIGCDKAWKFSAISYRKNEHVVEEGGGILSAFSAFKIVRSRIIFHFLYF